MQQGTRTRSYGPALTGLGHAPARCSGAPGRLAVLLLASVCAAAGCGDGGVDCAFAACGGDPVGTWEFAAACADYSIEQEQLREDCPGAEATGHWEATGATTIAADGTYSMVLSQTELEVITIPAECIDRERVSSCETLIEHDAVVCSGEIESSCQCQNASPGPRDKSSSGTWTTDGHQITLDGGASRRWGAAYCVTDDTLKLQLMPPDTADHALVTYVLSRI